MVERNDHEAMAAAAIRLLEDNDLASSIARRGLESCRKYRWAEVQSEWLNLYHELARNDSAKQSAR
jgi:glycosyltransferase involved in cell wall biosynthesis